MGLFNKHGGTSTSSSNHTCPMPSDLVQLPSENFVAGMTFERFNTILSGACTAFAVLVIISLMFMHALRYSRPNEQSKIIRICWLVPLYATFSFLSIAFPNAYFYLHSWLDYFQSIALASFFLLLCQFVSPNDHEREQFFAPLKIASRRKKSEPINGLVWYRRKWIFIFQYPIVALLVAIATDITQAANLYCFTSSAVYYAHIWLEIIINVSLSFAVLSVIQFYMQLKGHLKHHKPLAKLLAFKLLVGLTFIQGIVFWILRATNVLKPDAVLTWTDVNLGIPTMVVCAEMVLFALFYWYAYDFRPYLLSHSRPLLATELEDDETSYSGKGMAGGLNNAAQVQSYQGGFLGWRAWINVLLPIDVIRGIRFAFSMASQLRKDPTAPTYRENYQQV